jgi:hypothetical protein
LLEWQVAVKQPPVLLLQPLLEQALQLPRAPFEQPRTFAS